MKNVTWSTTYVPKAGHALAIFLTEANFQPGEFIVLDADHEAPGQYKVVFVKGKA